MNKKQNKEYTTLQIKKEINFHIKDFCNRNNVHASTITEMLWGNFISSSLTGSNFI
jgi:predicted transcriptional regulator